MLQKKFIWKCATFLWSVCLIERMEFIMSAEAQCIMCALDGLDSDFGSGCYFKIVET